ncbi:MAG: 2-oxoacid:acceptor oxidoreductase family protein [Eubacteriales bacterium]
MVEIRIHGRFGQPIGAIAKKIGNYALKEGYETQVFNAFAAIRPGSPTNSVIRVDTEKIIERSAQETKPDIVVVLDNSLFTAANVFKGLKAGGKVMALNADRSILGENSSKYSYEALDSYFADDPSEIEGNIIKALKANAIF